MAERNCMLAAFTLPNSAFVVQRIGREIPDLVIGVRFLSRA